MHVPLKDPLGSYLRDLSSACQLLSTTGTPQGKVSLKEATECVRNVREKLLGVKIPPHRVTETLVALYTIQATASAAAHITVVEIMDRVFACY
jgi:hypothetical protein